MKKVLVLEEVTEKGSEWGISFTDHNPEAKDYFKMPDAETAQRLKSYLAEYASQQAQESIPPVSAREDVFNEINQERIKQDLKWGEQNHAPADWLMILGEEVGEVNKAALEAKFGSSTLREYREELVQVAAVTVAMIECFDRNHLPPPPSNR